MSNTNLSSNADSIQSSKSETTGETATKVCNRCGKTLPLSQFRFRNKKTGLRRLECGSCQNKQVADHVRANPVKKSLSEAKQRAKRKGLEFDLTEEFLISIDRDTCPYLNIPIEWGYGRSGVRQPNSKSLDRIDSAKGYTQDNVIYCSWKANRLLSDASLEDICLIAHNFRRILTSTKPTDES